MHRPTLLVVEPEPLNALSMQACAGNSEVHVTTAHSTQEALELFALFPNISMVVIAMGDNIDCVLVARSIKRSDPRMPIVVISALAIEDCEIADHRIPSHEPEKLVELVRSKLGDPRRLEPPSSQTV